MPERLSEGVTFREPFYNLIAYLDGSVEDQRRAVLEPIFNARSSGAYRFRFLVETPKEEKFVITPEGQFITYADSAGWRIGNPKRMSVAVPDDGTYRFILESAGDDGETVYDVALYANHRVQTLFKADLIDLVPGIQALVYDRYQNLWIWTGDLMIPVTILYDNYVFDGPNKSLYVTQPYSQVELS